MSGISFTGNSITIAMSSGFAGGTNPMLVYNIETTVVPVPAAFWLFGSGLIGLIGLAKRKKLA